MLQNAYTNSRHTQLHKCQWCIFGTFWWNIAHIRSLSLLSKANCWYIDEKILTWCYCIFQEKNYNVSLSNHKVYSDNYIIQFTFIFVSLKFLLNLIYSSTYLGYSVQKCALHSLYSQWYSSKRFKYYRHLKCTYRPFITAYIILFNFIL